MRAVVRFVAAVMMVSGVLLVSDAVITLLWQEPVSAFVADREQGRLEEALADPPPRVIRKDPIPGDAIAKLSIPAIDVSEYVVEGTDTGNLRKGPGHYPSTPMPGERGTVAIAGHRTTYGAPFRRLDDVKRGDRIVLDLPYGRYVYRVERTKIVQPTDLSVLDRVRYDRLVLTACHPLYSAAERIVAFARLVKRAPGRVRQRS
jgi:sortase A